MKVFTDSKRVPLSRSLTHRDENFPEHKGNTSQRDNTMRIRQHVGRNIITSIRYMNIVLIYHICDVIKRISKYAWSDASRSSIRFTYSSVARHFGPCICHNSQTYTWNYVFPYKGRMIRVLSSVSTAFFTV